MQTPQKIEIEEGLRVALEWSDGSTQTLTARQLRDACSCANCSTRPAGNLLVQSTTIAEAHLVGSYGINFTFSPDGHHTGIFTFDQLRALGGRAD